jgi:hypothetical protein
MGFKSRSASFMEQTAQLLAPPYRTILVWQCEQNVPSTSLLLSEQPALWGISCVGVAEIFFALSCFHSEAVAGFIRPMVIISEQSEAQADKRKCTAFSRRSGVSLAIGGLGSAFDCTPSEWEVTPVPSKGCVWWWWRRGIGCV